MHIDIVYKKGQQLLQLLRKLRGSNVRRHILALVHTSLTESILTFNISSWCCFLSIKHKTNSS